MFGLIGRTQAWGSAPDKEPHHPRHQQTQRPPVPDAQQEEPDAKQAKDGAERLGHSSAFSAARGGMMLRSISPQKPGWMRV